MNKTLIPCTRCNGSGKVDLDERTTATLAVFKRKQLTVQDVAKALKESDISLPAINNRLERLRGLGLVTRRREGRYFFYSRVPKP